MGSCFLSFLEAQSKLLTSASELIAPLGVYKEVGKGLSDTLNGTVKEATVGWLAAAQVSLSAMNANKFRSWVELCSHFAQIFVCAVLIVDVSFGRGIIRCENLWLL